MVSTNLVLLYSQSVQVYFCLTNFSIRLIVSLEIHIEIKFWIAKNVREGGGGVSRIFGFLGPDDQMTSLVKFPNIFVKFQP